MSIFDSIKYPVPEPCTYSYLRTLPDDIRDSFFRKFKDSQLSIRLMINGNDFEMPAEKRALLIKTILEYEPV